MWHSDLHAANVFLEAKDNPRIAGIIDWQGMSAGPLYLQAVLADFFVYKGSNVIINTGTHASFETLPGLADTQPLTHIEALELDQLPEHLLVIGGGYVGLEMAQAFRRFGSKVTLIDHNDRLVHREDDDVTEALQALFEAEGIDLVLKGRIKQISGKSEDFSLQCKTYT